MCVVLETSLQLVEFLAKVFCSFRNMKAVFTRASLQLSLPDGKLQACKPQIHIININYVDEALDCSP